VGIVGNHGLSLHKQGSDMWPTRDPDEQVEVLRWISWNDCHWAPAVAPFYFEHIVKSTFGIGSPDVESLKPKVANLRKFAEVLEGHLNGRERVACGKLTIADFQLASMATDWREAAMPFCDFPNILRWLDGLAHIPAWANPWPVARVSN
jgi:glutathione S-transferase